MEQNRAKMSSGVRKSMAVDTQQDDWMSCVCSLCACGAHSCSTFELSNIVLGHNRCAGEMEDKQSSESENDDEQRARCGCLDEQRYLSESSKSEQLAGERGELLRVLVTRPEIASKPRDNILFEGDMDLKTTFETSYEALAKMRLDHWKQQQQQQQKDDAQTSGKTRPRRNRRPKRQEEPKANGEPEVSVRPRTHKSKSKVKERPERTGSGELSESNELASGAEVGRAKSQSAGDAQADPREALEAQQEPTLSLPNDYIDPDLSSIIVYDANMNRLEKVGLRKRSKYRPSTSLKSGDRGLFGDGAAGEPNGIGKHRQAATMRDTSTQTPVQSELESQKVADNLDSDKKHKNEPSQNARNLNDSIQSNYFTFSSKNLPIDSKRKVRDNVNMIDHIREQNIVEKREMSTVRKEAIDGVLKEQNEFLLGMKNLELAKQEEADAVEEIQRLIREEHPPEKIESEVIKEVEANGGEWNDTRSRSSKQQRTCQNQSFNLFENNYPENRSNGFKKDISNVSSSRVSPQSRICTNLFRESPDFILTTGKFAEQNHDDSRESQIAKVNKYECNDNQISAISNEIVDAKFRCVDEDESKSPVNCKVLSLNENFRYVGTQAGHKFFVEEH